MHQIAGVATQLKEAMTPEFKQYVKQVRANCVAMCSKLTSYGYSIATGGSDNHLILWDLKPQGTNGSKIQTICDACNITLNKNAVLGDRSALTPGGVRIGTPALTTRGLDEAAFVKVAEFLHEAVTLAIKIQGSAPKITMKEFTAAVEASAEVKDLKFAVQSFITQYPMPGFDTATMRYKTVVHE